MIPIESIDCLNNYNGINISISKAILTYLTGQAMMEVPEPAQQCYADRLSVSVQNLNSFKNTYIDCRVCFALKTSVIIFINNSCNKGANYDQNENHGNF